MFTPRSHHDIFDLFHQYTQFSIPFFLICNCTFYAVSIREQTVFSIHMHHFSACVFRPSVQRFLCITVLISHLHLLYILSCFITSSFHYDKLRFTLFHRIFHHLHFISTHLLSVSINFILRCFITSSFHYGHVILLFFPYALCVALSLYGLNTADTA